MSVTKEFVTVADSTDIDLGRSLSLEVNEVQVLICHTQDGFFAMDNKCTHANEPLCGGRIVGNLITCPVHGAIFDVRNGEVKGPPASIKLRTFDESAKKTELKIKSINEYKNLLVSKLI